MSLARGATGRSRLGAAIRSRLGVETFGGNLIFGGQTFTSQGGITNINKIGKWTGLQFFPLQTGTNAFDVHALIKHNGHLFATGTFTDMSSSGAVRIAEWDGAAWSALGAGLAGGPPAIAGNALAVYNGKLIVTGAFTTADGGAAAQIAEWDGASWAALGAGIGMSAGNSLAVYNSELYLGGSFTSVSGLASTANIAKWTGSAWSALPGGGANGTVAALMVHGSTLFAGGSFSAIGGVATPNYVAQFDGSVWSAVGAAFTFDNGIGCFTIYNGNLIAGGSFTGRVKSWDGSAWSNVGSFPNSNAVYALAVFRGKLIAGGDFNSGGLKAFAQFDGTSWTALHANTNVTVRALTVL